jgi:hypothetical protein
MEWVGALASLFVVLLLVLPLAAVIGLRLFLWAAGLARYARPG